MEPKNESNTSHMEKQSALYKSPCFIGGGVAEWFRALDLTSGGPWFKSFTLSLSGFVLGSPKFNSSTNWSVPYHLGFL